MNTQINDAIETLGLDSQMELSQEALELVAKFEQLEEEIEEDGQIEQFFEALTLDINKLTIWDEQLICEYIFGF